MTRELLYGLVGHPRTHLLEQRLFATVCLFFGVANLLGAANFVATPWLLGVHVLAGAGFFGLYAHARKTGRRRFGALVVLVLAFLGVSALADGGIRGGTHYYLILGLVMAAVLGERWVWTLLAGAGFALLAAGLVAVELLAPELVTTTPGTPASRTLDVGAQLITVMVFSGVMVEILRQNLEAERATSERLLRSILPAEVASELKATDRVTPRLYDAATVLFTDFVGFTRVAEAMTPEQLVHELDTCFRAFDAVMADHSMEKIKTIGDAYMAAGGIPTPTKTHPVDAILAALRVQRRLAALRAARLADGRPYWDIRLGIHTGPLVAGVIGDAKFAYDVWGDTVNTASRLESTSQPGRVNVSATTAQAAEAFFVFEPRGRIPAKNKAPLEMFFVRGIRPALTDDGITPNQAFWERYRRL